MRVVFTWRMTGSTEEIMDSCWLAEAEAESLHDAEPSDKPLLGFFND